ncbi:MAG: DUF3800 domain-containing protein [Clostridiales Family XIII bacterium]|jgi:hypothetical protein|nr:DUF3800 domain-containing protein [Clostridiales Family XIII bacterium]
MTYIYFDESGDLSKNFDRPTASKCFYITFIIVNDPKAIEKVIKKVIAHSKHTPRFRGYLHAAHDRDETVLRGLRYLARKDIRAVCLRVDKTHLPEKAAQDVLYKKLVLTLIKRLYKNSILDPAEKYNFVGSRYYSNKRLDREFIDYISANTSNINVETAWTHDDKCLQAVDYFSMAFYRKHENNDSRFYNIIAGSVAGNYSV